MSGVFNNPFYHGTIDLIEKIDVGKGKPRKDFGRGFYMAADIRQAIGMMQKKRREFLARHPQVSAAEVVERMYRVQLKPSAVSMFKVKVFEKPDREWLDFVLGCRESSAERAHDFDIVVGATADDDTAVALKFYFKGVYGPVGGEEAKSNLLRILEPQNLGVQCCLCSQLAAEGAVMNFGQIDWRLYT